MKTILEIPFYKNNGDGKQCMQVAMKCIIKKLLGKEYSLEELDEITRRKPNNWTSTTQIVSALHNLGLDIKYYSKTDLKPYLEGESYIRQVYGQDADKILQNTDVDVFVESVKEVQKLKLHEKKIVTIREIEENISRGNIPLVVIDQNKITRKKDNYQGHFVIITGFDENNLYYHETGPKDAEPNKRIRKEILEKAMNANGTDNDCVIVYGLRNDEI